MVYRELLRLVSDEPVFASALLLAGRTNAARVRLQLSRWVTTGRILQLRRGLYVLAVPWRKVEPHPFVVANALQRGSFVSLQSALAFYGLIPEHVPTVTSVGPRRPETLRTPLGAFRFNHLSVSLLFGYSEVEIAPSQHAFVASPEKALLDLVYLTPRGDSPAFLESLRLQNLDTISESTLIELASRSDKPKLKRAARVIAALKADTDRAGEAG